MRAQKLNDIFVPIEDERELDAAKNTDGFAELDQCLDDHSVSLIIREAKDDSKKALRVPRILGKPRIISLYTQLTSFKKGRERIYDGLCYKGRNRCDCTERRRRSNQRRFAYRDGSETTVKKL